MQTLDGGPGRTELQTPSPMGSSRWLVVVLVAVAAVVLGALAVVLLSEGAETRVAAQTEGTSALDRPGGLDPARTPEVIGTPDASVGDTEADSAPSSPNPATSTPGLLSGGAVAAFDDLESAIGSEAQLVEIVVYDTYAIVEYRAPDDPDNIDRVVWRDGTVEEPEPVGFTEDHADTLFRAGQVDLAQIPALAEQAVEGFDLDGGEVTHVIVDRFFGLDDGGVGIRVYVTHPTRGGGGYLLASGDGTVIELVG